MTEFKWDEEVQKTLDNSGEEITAALEVGFDYRIKAKRAEEKFKELKKLANDTLEFVFEILGIEKIRAIGIGTIAQRTKTTTSYNIDVISKALAHNGVALPIIKKCIAKGKKVSESEYVEFRRATKK